MLDVMGPDFTRTARAKGTTRTRALVKHGLRVALIPMSTYFAYSFGTLVAGSAFLEIVFSWSGMGQYGIQAVQTSDINAVTGNVLFSAVIILFASTLSEVLYAALDRSEEHTSELQSRFDLVCRLLLEKKKHNIVRDMYL